MRDRERGGDERVRGDDYLVARSDPSGLQRERERRGSRGHADAVRDAAVVGELGLEARDLLAEDEAAAGDDPRERCRKLAFQRLVLALQRHEANPRQFTMRSQQPRSSHQLQSPDYFYV